jgi:TIR domain/NB-ARC domain
MATQSRNESSARVFISYARADGEAYARYLHDKLTAEGITCWWDREDLRRTSNWWRKIDQALESVEYLVAVLTPEILNSETCRKEWQWARRKGRCIVPVKAGMSFEAPTVPRWLKRGHAYQALDLPQKNPSPGSEWQKFINDLNTTPKVEKVPFMTGDLPEDFVARPEEFNKLLAMLIDTERSEPVAITAALRGAGGYGKTTLAKALCHDLRVQEAFDDGILWVTLGEKAENLTGTYAIAFKHWPANGPTSPARAKRP